ncbi:glycosyltransferase family 87 protein [uncultured Aquimarina sp.]|nr:glycosyltransferase family 87 protein [uncultured Aquimarina sp.]
MYILPFIIFGIYYLIKSYWFLPHDFANYYFGAYFLDRGLFSPVIYDPIWFNQHIFEIQKNVFASYAPNTPFLAMFFWPFTLVSFSTAKLVFNITSLLLFIYALRNLFNEYKIPYIHYLTILLLFFFPIKNNILFGQVYLLLFFLISEGFLAYKKNNYYKMGGLWGLAILLKIFPIILFAFLLFRKKIKGLIVLAFCSLGFLGISIYLNGIDSWMFFFENILPKATKGEISGEFIKNYQSILMFLKHIFVYHQTKNPFPLIDNSYYYHFFLLLSKIILVGYGLYFSYKKKQAIQGFSYWILATYLLSPYGSNYSSLLLIFIVIMVFSDTFDFRNKNNIGILLLLFLISNLPIKYFFDFPLPLSFFKLFLFISLWLVLILEKHISYKLHLTIGSISIIVSLLVTSLSHKKPAMLTKTNMLFEDQQQSIIYDYTIKNGYLVYKYWSEKGSQTKKTDYKITSINYNDIYLKDNNVYYLDKQITDDTAHKLKPAIVNGNTLIYLSDYQRGFGFYNFHKTLINN